MLICNPNNPTSTSVGLDQIEAFLDRVPSHVCVILDEAYCEFALNLGDTYASVELLRRYPNLVLLRTFSKVYGLAGAARRVRAVRLGRSSGPRSTRSASRSTSTSPPRRRPSRR